eukprot:m.453695 g.453695  ORF g.453695 m.453695 type:complete len:93 (-) comp56940_c0_seq4:983-1261(-)
MARRIVWVDSDEGIKSDTGLLTSAGFQVECFHDVLKSFISSRSNFPRSMFVLGPFPFSSFRLVFWFCSRYRNSVSLCPEGDHHILDEAGRAG